jgi:hypothetical protein
MVEVVRLAEEAGDVGRQGRQHRLAFVDPLLPLDERAVVPEAGHAQQAQPFGQARVDQRRLGVGQVDARVAVKHRGDRAEVLGREGELTAGVPWSSVGEFCAGHRVQAASA